MRTPNNLPANVQKELSAILEANQIKSSKQILTRRTARKFNKALLYTLAWVGSLAIVITALSIFGLIPKY